MMYSIGIESGKRSDNGKKFVQQAVRRRREVADAGSDMIGRVAMLVAIGALSLILFGACNGKPSIPSVELAAADSFEQPIPVLHDLAGVDQLKVAFNEDEGLPRLVLLLSPT